MIFYLMLRCSVMGSAMFWSFFLPSFCVYIFTVSYNTNITLIKDDALHVYLVHFHLI